MKIVSRYILTTYLRIVSLCIGSFVAIYLIIDFLDKVGRFTRAGGTFGPMMLFFVWKIPEIVSQIAPLAVLMATLLTLGTLSRNSEITAMRSCGISLLTITAPLLVAAALISMAGVIAGETIVPGSIDRTRYIEEVLIRKHSPHTFFRQQNIWHREDRAILQARSFDPAGLILKGVTLWQLGEGMTPAARIDAARAELRNGVWMFHDLVVRTFENGTVTRTSTMDRSQIPLDLNLEELKVAGKAADHMGFRQLRRYIANLEKGGYETTRYVAQMHARLAFPFASLVMAFLGIPFALRTGRTSGIAVGVGASLGIGFGYFVINAILLSFGQSGVLPAIIAAWSANCIFTALGVWLAMTINR